MNSINFNETFLDDNYSFETLLAKTKAANLNLNELRDLLLQHQQDLNQTSLELFNNSYDRFYKLSYIISCLSEPIQHLIDPTQRFRNQLAELCGDHDSYVNQINTKLASLEDASRNRELAKQLVGFIKRSNRIESQMDNIDWSVKGLSSRVDNKNGHLEHLIKCDLLERVSIEIFHLTSEIRSLQPTHDELITIKESLEACLERRNSQLDNWFNEAFSSAIESHDELMIDLVLRTYQQKGSTSKLDQVWRNKVLKPYLNLTLTEAQMANQIAQTYEHLDAFIRKKMHLIKADFIARSFWQEVINSLDKLERFYSLNDLDLFRSRYIQTRAFLAKQNDYVELNNTQINEDSARILKKFNSMGYFNHRFSQIASSVESGLIKQPLSEIPDNHSVSQGERKVKFRLKICMHIYASVTKCWSDELYIETLELSFSQLGCRIINRFGEWLSKLRLSDFRITGLGTPENNRHTNFLAKQDAIMRHLIEDCTRLIGNIKEFLSGLGNKQPDLATIRDELFSESFISLMNGLGNVKSLQRLIER